MQGYLGVVLKLVEATALVDDRDLQRDVIQDVLLAASAVAEKRGVSVTSHGGKAAVPWLIGVVAADSEAARGSGSQLNSLGCLVVKALLSLKPVLLRPVVDRFVSYC